MPSKNTKKPVDYAALKKLWAMALGGGGVTFVVALLHWGLVSAPKLIPIVIIFALSSIVFSALFFFSSLIAAPQLGQYIIGDDTKIKGSTVEMVTHVQQSGDAELDRWVKRYVFTRNMFGLAIIPLLLLGGVLLFA